MSNDPGSLPPSSPPPTSASTPAPVDPATAVKIPAMCLMIAGAVGILALCVGILLGLLGMGAGALNGGGNGAMQMMSGGIGIVFRIIVILLQAVMIFGAFKMSKLQSYNLAMASAVIAVVPCISPCCIVGIPFGVWALIVLLKPEVKAAFTK